MPVTIQIRNVPDELYRKLKARAAEARMSLSEYILRDVAENAVPPTTTEWLEKVKKLKPIRTRETTAEAIRAIRGR